MSMASFARLRRGFLILGCVISINLMTCTSSTTLDSPKSHNTQSHEPHIKLPQSKEDRYIKPYISVSVQSPPKRINDSLAEQQSDSGGIPTQSRSSATINLFVSTSETDRRLPRHHSSLISASSSVMDYNEDLRKYISKPIERPQTRQLISRNHKPRHRQTSWSTYFPSVPAHSGTTESNSRREIPSDDKRSKEHSWTPSSELHLAIPVRMYLYRGKDTPQDSSHDEAGTGTDVQNLPVKESVVSPRLSKRIYIPIRFSDDNMLFTTTNHRDCVQCPENYTLTPERGSTYVQVPVPEISVCPYLAFVPGRLNVAITSGPRVGSFISEGEYPVKLTVWKRGGHMFSCEFSFIVKAAQCPPLSSPSAGTIHCSNGTLWGSHCHISCPENYTVIGHSSTTCEGTSRDVMWTNGPLDCISKKVFETSGALGCTKPRAPSGGTVLCDKEAVGEEYRDGTICQFFCFPGYVMSTQPSNNLLAVCSNGSWSPEHEITCTASHCPQAPQPHRGYTLCSDPASQPLHLEQQISTKTQYFNGTVCKFHCEIGYVIPTSQQPVSVIICAAPEWNASSIPDCKRAVPPTHHPEDCKNKTLVTDPRDKAQTILPRFISSSGQPLSPTCSLPKFLSPGVHINFCEAIDPEYRATSTCSYYIKVIERLPPEPHPKDCRNRILTADRRGTAILKPTRFLLMRMESPKVIEATCTYSKKIGVGTHINNCSATDPELNTTSFCSFTLTVKGVTCPQPPSISNGAIHCHPKPLTPVTYPPRTTCIVKCDDGYVLTSNQKKWKRWKCLPKQLQWNQTKVPKCRRAISPKPFAKDCHHKTLFLKGRNTVWPKKPRFKSSFKGAKVKVRCTLNRPLTAGLYTNICEAKDVEMRTSASCSYNITVKAKDCPPLPEIPHGDLVCSSADITLGYQVGVVCRYFCHYGYTIPSSLINYESRKCIAFRKWNISVLPSCVREIAPQSTDSSCLHEVMAAEDPLAIIWSPPSFVSSAGTVLQTHCEPGNITAYGIYNISCSAFDPELRLNGSCEFSVLVQKPSNVDELESGTVQCEELLELPNSKLECSPADTFGYLVGTVCRYLCLPGYTVPSSLQNFVARNCTELQIWNTTILPSCLSEIAPYPADSSCHDEILTVDDPQDVRFSMPYFVSSTGITLEADCEPSNISSHGVYKISCTAYDPELRLNGACEFTIHVQKSPILGELDSEIVHCPELPEILSSELECSSAADATDGYPVGTVCSYVCHPGYTIPSSLQDFAVRNCTEAQQWSIMTLPSCLKKIAPYPADSFCRNENLTTDDPSQIQLSPAEFVLSDGVRIQADCELPTITDYGVFNVTCSAHDPELRLNGSCEFTVDVQKPYVVEETDIQNDGCLTPESVPNSEMKCSPNNSLIHPSSAVCSYVCYEGYAVPLHQKNLSTIVCNVEHKWNATEVPSCEAVSSAFLYPTCPDQSVNTSSPANVIVADPEVITTNNESAKVSCSPQRFDKFGTFEISCEAYDQFFGITSFCSFILTVSELQVFEPTTIESSLNISEDDHNIPTPSPSTYCDPLTSPTNGHLKCTSTEISDNCDTTCNAGYHFPSAYDSLRNYHLICDRTNGQWNFQKDYNIIDLPDCLGELPTTSWQVWLKFKVSVENCDEENMSVLQNEIQAFLMALNVNVCNVTVDCSQLQYYCDKDSERDLLTLEVTWTVEASFNPDDYESEDIVPNAETQIEMVLENTQRAVTVEQEFRSQVLTFSADLLQDSYRQGKFILICQKRGFIVDFRTDKCVECPSGTYEERTQCEPCPANHYQDKTGQLSCIPCPAGKISTPGSRSLLECKE